MNEKPEPSDDHLYYMVTFRGHILQFFANAIEFYKSILTRDVAAVREDPDLAGLFPESEESSNRGRYEIEQAEQMLEWLNRNIQERGHHPFGCELNISHGAVRYLKSTALLYLQRLRQKREVLAHGPNVSRHVLAEVDQKIARYEEITEMGVFGGASRLDLLIASPPEIELDSKTDTPDQRLQSYVKPAPVVHDSIEILDPQLKERCMDLFKQFSEGGAHHRLDIVLAEATKILESRIRTKSGAQPGMTTTKLVAFAFKAEAPQLQVSIAADKQTAVLNWINGVFGFVRNDVHHNVVEDLQPARVLQLVGMIDYLLSLVDAAAKASDVRA